MNHNPFLIRCVLMFAVGLAFLGIPSGVELTMRNPTMGVSGTFLEISGGVTAQRV